MQSSQEWGSFRIYSEDHGGAPDRILWRRQEVRRLRYSSTRRQWLHGRPTHALKRVARVVVGIRVPEAAARNLRPLRALLAQHDLHDDLVARELEVC